LRLARHGFALFENNAIRKSTFAANLFLMSARIMDGGRTLFTVRVARFVASAFLRDGTLPRRDCCVALFLIFESVIHRILLRFDIRSAPALPRMCERNRDATGLRHYALS